MPILKTTKRSPLGLFVTSLVVLFLFLSGIPVETQAQLSTWIIDDNTNINTSANNSDNLNRLFGLNPSGLTNIAGAGCAGTGYAPTTYGTLTNRGFNIADSNPITSGNKFLSFGWSITAPQAGYYSIWVSIPKLTVAQAQSCFVPTSFPNNATYQVTYPGFTTPSRAINLDPTITRAGSLSIDAGTYWLESLFPQTGNGQIQVVYLQQNTTLQVTANNYYPNANQGALKIPIDAVQIRLESALSMNLTYLNSNNNVVGTNCDPPQSPAGTSNDWHFQITNVPAGYRPALLSGPSGGFWRYGACSSNRNWPLGVTPTNGTLNTVNNTYTWDIYAQPYPGTLPSGTFTIQLTGPNNAVISTSKTF